MGGPQGKAKQSKDKLSEDLKGREEERVARENYILKELAPLNKGYDIASVEKHLRKMVKKCLMLTLD